MDRVNYFRYVNEIMTCKEEEEEEGLFIVKDK